MNDDDEAQLRKMSGTSEAAAIRKTYMMMSSDEPPTGKPLAQPSAKYTDHRPQPSCRLVHDIMGKAAVGMWHTDAAAAEQGGSEPYRQGAGERY